MRLRGALQCRDPRVERGTGLADVDRRPERTFGEQRETVRRRVTGNGQAGVDRAAEPCGLEIAPRGIGKVRRIHALQRAQPRRRGCRSEEHTSELPSLMRISYAVFFLKKKNTTKQPKTP